MTETLLCSTFESREEGNTIIEFVSLLLLLIAPLFTYFVWVTLIAQENLKSAEVLREVGQIINSESDLSTAINISKRYLVLEGFDGDLLVNCITGDCPHRGSVIEIHIQRGVRKFSSTIQGGRWQ